MKISERANDTKALNLNPQEPNCSEQIVIIRFHNKTVPFNRQPSELQIRVVFS
ncbi:hypothetical protein DPMN_079197 [Dreissena polymorpha]|uniref:Uncharacterized protein n=1 Tax=Dreissena polymorpha TaxID=45954 RepID=A0A9D3YP44_DREPO|nr:hypothetical protein DPMN_079197 [Dreissena polymorpha]